MLRPRTLCTASLVLALALVLIVALMPTGLANAVFRTTPTRIPTATSIGGPTLPPPPDAPTLPPPVGPTPIGGPTRVGPTPIGGPTLVGPT
ncbi:MAG: hypothetical protein GYB65_04570, partial [Chloroflexi bacterium]|nr:hypothetical protein [Chloroflexota bacterium]